MHYYLLLIIAVAWEVYWKYIALFHCAKYNNKKTAKILEPNKKIIVL